MIQIQYVLSWYVGIGVEFLASFIVVRLKAELLKT